MMVFEKVYEIYENIIIKTLEQTKTDEEIDEMLDSGSIHDMVLKRLAKALTVAVYRNGKIDGSHQFLCVLSEDKINKFSCSVRIF